MQSNDRTPEPTRQLDLRAGGLVGVALVDLHERAADAGLVDRLAWREWIDGYVREGRSLAAIYRWAAAFARSDLTALLESPRRRVRSAELVPVRRGPRPLSLYHVHAPDLGALERAVEELIAEVHAREVRARRAAIAVVGAEPRSGTRRRRRW